MRTARFGSLLRPILTRWRERGERAGVSTVPARCAVPMLARIIAILALVDVRGCRCRRTLARSPRGVGRMRPEFIGNKFDCMKGAVLGALREKELLQGLVVDAMARPPLSCWKDDVDRYAEYLRLGGTHQIAKHNVQWGTGKRQQYFAELDRYSGRNLFLDPDVGVATGSRRGQSTSAPPRPAASCRTRISLPCTSTVPGGKRSNSGCRPSCKRYRDACRASSALPTWSRTPAYSS